MINGYGGMPGWFVNVFGWGMAIALVILSFLLTAIPWGNRSNARALDSDGDLIPPPILDRLVDQSRIQDARNDPTIASYSLPTSSTPTAETNETTKEDAR